MFRVYEFKDIHGYLRPSGQNNTVEVIITPALKYAREEAEKYPYPIPESVYYHDWAEGDQPDNDGWGNGTYTHRNFIRKISSDFGWDWGPAFIPSGILSFELISRKTAVIDGVTVFQQHASGGRVTLSVKAHVNAVVPASGKLVAKVQQRQVLANEANPVTTASSSYVLQQGENELALEVEVLDAKLWWPVGYGEPNLYDLDLEFEAQANDYGVDGAAEHSGLTRRIGLRTVEKVTDPLPGGSSFFFRVNGVDIYAKGSNFIPADVFQPRAEKDLEWIIQSAVEANMNMVRVWGGGMYQVDKFYELADEKGLMIWQEMMFGCALYPRSPEFLASITEEITQQARRLQHHPSIVIWGGNNENEGALLWYAASRANKDLYVTDYNALYVRTARAALLAVDGSVNFVDSSPSNGIYNTSLYYAKRWGDVADTHYGDVHYYNYAADCEDYTTYPKARFVSEHGFQSFPAFVEYRPVLAVEDYSWNSSQLFYRQRHPDGQQQMVDMLRRHFRVPSEFAGKGQSQQKVFDDYLFLTQVQQSRCYETAFAQWRRLRSEPDVNTMGILYWQLNDIWQGPSWTSIEHSGRWRLTHSAVQRSFEPVMLSMVVDNTTGKDVVRTYLTSDLTENVSVKVSVTFQKWASAPGDLARTLGYQCEVSVSAGTAQCPPLDLKQALAAADCTARTCFALARGYIDGKGGSIFGQAFLTPLKDAELPLVSIKIANTRKAGDRVAKFSVTANATAVYGTFESSFVGRFTPNAMLMLPGESMEIEFVGREDFDIDGFSKSVTFRSVRDTYDEADLKDPSFIALV